MIYGITLRGNFRCFWQIRWGNSSATFDSVVIFITLFITETVCFHFSFFSFPAGGGECRRSGRFFSEVSVAEAPEAVPDAVEAVLEVALVILSGAKCTTA